MYRVHGITVVGRVAGFAAAVLVAARPAWSSLATGTLFTNFTSATFSLRTGVAGDNTYTGMNPINVPNAATAWVLATDTPPMGMSLFKTASPASAAPGDLVWFTISYSNTGFITAYSVTLTDIFPPRAVRSTLPMSMWGQSGVPSGTWATSLSGPWNTTSSAGQTSPLFLRWILPQVSAHKSGYIRYAVTIQ